MHALLLCCVQGVLLGGALKNDTKEIKDWNVKYILINRVPVTFRMQKLEDGSQGQEILEEPAVTETTLSPDEDPKMVTD